jgi:protein involved in polysaccharide export with SLBB domain
MITKISKKFVFWGSLASLVLVMAGLTGCQSAPPAPQKFADVPGVTPAPTVLDRTPTAVPAPAPAATALNSGGPIENKIDVIQPGDALTITFKDLPKDEVANLPSEERVKQDGSITLLHNQTFMAAGKTRGELEKDIRERYVPKYYVNMTVSVKQQEATRFYFVGGEVKIPGRQVYISRMTVLKAIQSCGDFTDFANKKKVRLTRADGKTKLVVNAVKALENPTLDVEVYPGDTIHVPRSIW